MLGDMLRSDSILVRVTTAAFVFFAPLYVLQSYGSRWAFPVAILALLSLLFANFGRTFRGDSLSGVTVSPTERVVQ